MNLVKCRPKCVHLHLLERFSKFLWAVVMCCCICFWQWCMPINPNPDLKWTCWNVDLIVCTSICLKGSLSSRFCNLQLLLDLMRKMVGVYMYSDVWCIADVTCTMQQQMRKETCCQRDIWEVCIAAQMEENVQSKKVLMGQRGLSIWRWSGATLPCILFVGPRLLFFGYLIILWYALKLKSTHLSTCFQMLATITDQHVWEWWFLHINCANSYTHTHTHKNMYSFIE